MARRVLLLRRFDAQAEPERERMHDEVPVTAEPGFYEPGRSPSLLLANWFWMRHIVRALRRGGHESLRAFDEMDAATGLRGRHRHVNGCEVSNHLRLPAQRRTPH